MLDTPLRLALGLLTGVAFGVLLQKGRVAKHGVIVGQLLLLDFTVVKIMLTAVAVGAVGFWALAALGEVPIAVKPAETGGVVIGAMLFGIGLAVLGYCPGTTIAAVGEGHPDAVAGFLGMCAGAGAFVAAFPVVRGVQQAWRDWGEVTIPAVTHTRPAAWIAVLAAAALALYLAGGRRGARPAAPR